MKHTILPCPGSCNVSKMTKTVAKHFETSAKVVPEMTTEFIDSITENSNLIALNGCPATCASNLYKKFGFDTYSEITITKNFDIGNQKKYESLDNLETEINYVKAELNKL
ncbi:putative zinc-binding protein [Eubacteriaceae bacterium ES2]|nr:putative zinc-binding protein [Eubacteriaceae bacterium ES2]